MKDSIELNFAGEVNWAEMPGSDASDEFSPSAEQPRRPFRRRAALLREERRAEAKSVESAMQSARALPPPSDDAVRAPGRASRSEAPKDDGREPLPPHLAPRRVDPVELQWNALRRVSPGLRQQVLANTPLVNLHRDDPASRAFDQLRTRLLQALKANGWRRIAIAGPTPGCGSTFTAANLALSMARIPGLRTVLMDLNQRDPGIASLLSVDGCGDMRGYLSGDVPMAEHLVRMGESLALGLTGKPDMDAAELLHDDQTAAVLDSMTADLNPDVVLYDLPAILAYDDLVAFLPQVDGVLIVADGTKTLARHIEQCESLLQGQTRIMGVVLNEARSSSVENWGA